jgi:hypothetical protein
LKETTPDRFITLYDLSGDFAGGMKQALMSASLYDKSVDSPQRPSMWQGFKDRGVILKTSTLTDVVVKICDMAMRLEPYVRKDKGERIEAEYTASEWMLACHYSKYLHLYMGDNFKAGGAFKAHVYYLLAGARVYFLPGPRFSHRGYGPMEVHVITDTKLQHRQNMHRLGQSVYSTRAVVQHLNPQKDAFSLETQHDDMVHEVARFLDLNQAMCMFKKIGRHHRTSIVKVGIISCQHYV